MDGVCLYTVQTMQGDIMDQKFYGEQLNLVS